MKVVAKWRSQNGRRGLQIVSDASEFPAAAQGTLLSLGTTAGTTIFQFVPKDGDNWIITGDDLEPVAGCSIVHSEDLQGGSCVTLLVARPGAVWRSYGYRRRGSAYMVLSKDGRIERAEPALLVAAGIVKPSPETVVAIPEPPQIDGDLQAALKKAGLI